MKIAQNIFKYVMKCAINLDERQKASWVTHKLVEMNCFLRTASIEWVTNPGADSCSLPLPAISLTQTILQLLIQKRNIFRVMKWSVKHICFLILLARDIEFAKCFTRASFQKLTMLPPQKSCKLRQFWQKIENGGCFSPLSCTDCQFLCNYDAISDVAEK